MGERKKVGKGKRFNIFRRDGFTCQYCGRQPPEVVLQIDHIHPIIEGGTNDEMNLVTACRDCNLGKGKKLLEAPQRPDADLAWLGAQQELAELRAYQEAKRARDELINAIVGDLQAMWMEYSGRDWAPRASDIKQMLARYDPVFVEQALQSTALKVVSYYVTGYDGSLKYTWATLRNMVREAGHAN